jgi:hypothetical protein
MGPRGEGHGESARGAGGLTGRVATPPSWRSERARGAGALIGGGRLGMEDDMAEHHEVHHRERGHHHQVDGLGGNAQHAGQHGRGRGGQAVVHGGRHQVAPHLVAHRQRELLVMDPHEDPVEVELDQQRDGRSRSRARPGSEGPRRRRARWWWSHTRPPRSPRRTGSARPGRARPSWASAGCAPSRRTRSRRLGAAAGDPSRAYSRQLAASSSRARSTSGPAAPPPARSGPRGSAA